jgi:hypothetical protein
MIDQAKRRKSTASITTTAKVNGVESSGEPSGCPAKSEVT